MEISELNLNLVGDFEAGIKCLQNPSLISNLSLLTKLPQFYKFWTYTALILAVFATFTNLFNKIKLFFHKIRIKFLTSCQNSCPQQIFDDFDFDFEFSDDGDDDTPSSVDDSDEEELESEDDRVSAVFREEGCSSYWGEGQNGNLTLRRRNRFSWSDFSAGKSVVQLWDSFGLGLDFEDDEDESGGEIAIWDLNRDVKLSSGRRCRLAPPSSAAATAEEKVVLTAEMSDGDGGVGFGTYDSRVGGEWPEIYAAWRPRRRNVWSDGGGGGGGKEE